MNNHFIFGFHTSNMGREYGNYDPIEGCRGCEGTAGRLGCTIHSPNVYIADPPKPFAQLFLRCPHCGKDMQLDAYALKEE